MICSTKLQSLDLVFVQIYIIENFSVLLTSSKLNCSGLQYNVSSNYNLVWIAFRFCLLLYVNTCIRIQETLVQAPKSWARKVL
jgi:hypothetical protein